MKTFAITIASTFVMSGLTGQNFDPVEHLQNPIMATGDTVSNTYRFNNENLDLQAFSGNQRLDSLHHLKWNSVKGIWEPYAKNIYSFDENGNNTQIRIDCPENDTVWGETLWGSHILNTFAYNNNHQIVQAISQDWSVSGWINYSQQNYSYDSLGNLIESNFQRWINGEWVDQSRRIRSYDADNRIILLMKEDFIEDEWVGKDWIDYTYGSNGLIEIEHTLSHVTGGIYDEFRRVYIYNGQNQLAQINSQNPIGPIGSDQWEDFFHVIYTYDNSTVTITNEWINQDGWENMNQQVYMYVDDNLIIELNRRWLKNELIWLTTDSIYYYYSFPTAVDNILSERTIMLYPNPATSFLHVNTVNNNEEHFLTEKSKLQVYSGLGEMIYQTGMQELNNMTIDVSKYLPGTYHLVIQGNGKREVQSFVKQ